MNTSRVAAVAAAVAIGFGVTLAAVAVSDDGDDSPSIEADVTGGADAVGRESTPVDDPDEADDPGEPDEAPGATEPEEPDEVSPTLPATTAAEAPASTVESSAPDGERTTDVDAGDDLEDVRCVSTISVVLDTGEQVDLVVEAREGASWRVLDADGSFVISVDDPNVADVDEVLRNVRFFQGAPVEFLDDCDAVSPGDDDATSADAPSEGDSASFVVQFPCSDRALSALRQLLVDEDITSLDDVDEVQLALATRLDELGGRDVESWLVALDDVLVGFRSFPGGCAVAVEEGFTRSGIFCAAARISADVGLFEFLDTVVPIAMSDCTYEPDSDGQF